jgi:hypothetical protein
MAFREHQQREKEGKVNRVILLLILDNRLYQSFYPISCKLTETSQVLRISIEKAEPFLALPFSAIRLRN